MIRMKSLLRISVSWDNAYQTRCYHLIESSIPSRSIFVFRPKSPTNFKFGFSCSSTGVPSCVHFIHQIRTTRCLIREFSIYAAAVTLDYKNMENIEILGQILDGKLIARDVQQKISERAAELKSSTGIVPGLAIVQVGDRPDSNVYIRTKLKSAAEAGIMAQHIKLPASISEADIINTIQELNNDLKIHGIIVQLPLDCTNTIDAGRVTDTILPEKDVDGLHTANAGHFLHGDLTFGPLPCTPRGCLELIKRAGKKIEGSRAVVLGRSKIVGSPMAQLLIWNNATVTVCHSKTRDLPSVCREADILVVAIGKANFVHADWVKPGAVVIDCGINVVPDETSKSGRRIVGDVDFENVKNVASFITPVPGGVGPMTVAMLLQNTLDSAVRISKGN